MKKIKILAFLLLGAMTTIISCGPDPVDPPSAEEVQTALLAKTWIVETDANSVTLDNTDENGNWDGFSVVFSANGTYTASNVSVGREVVWPTNGTWVYKDAGTADVNVNLIERNGGVAKGGVDITILVSEASLKMTFNYADPDGRTSGTVGDWVFNMGL